MRLHLLEVMAAAERRSVAGQHDGADACRRWRSRRAPTISVSIIARLSALRFCGVFKRQDDDAVVAVAAEQLRRATAAERADMAVPKWFGRGMKNDAFGLASMPM